ncbi:MULTISPECIES: transporter substrate-binding domain-containing protein [unclassified Achromobacter]|uniref:transporter substrate-binding domain-containing protein n=1 Tax=unclassified Achromobacter TaxID=2626865 RepID=UPI000B5173ED|nr:MULTISPECIES: transporter substrate-binding domain-containing protein [unclassified Achromobacter]OWT71523.1 polar amino acid ABC transporter substrate-binding protein [Achromobacter sp. HZ34]OWT73180.1 polar amino acid ABC transporter substrate-binding protein [Achromobacter sp. HZ28]
MRKGFSAVLGSFLLSACALSGAAHAEFHTAVDATYSPHAMRDLSGNLIGFNIDLTNAMSKELGEKISIDGVEWNAIVPGLMSKKYDYIAAPMTVTPELAQSFIFTEGYLKSIYAFVQKKGTPDIKTSADLRGKIITVNKGNPMERWLQAHQQEYGYTFQSFGTNADAVQAVISGRAYANMATMPVIRWASKQNPLLTPASFSIDSGNVVAMAFRKDDGATRAKFSNALKCLKQKGVVSALVEKWMGYKPAADDLPAKAVDGTGIPGLPGYDATPVTLACSK